MSVSKFPSQMGNYRLNGRLLGQGAFSKVELATHRLLQLPVALKIIMKSMVTRISYMERNLHREAHILSRLDHPNIVKLLEIFESPDFYCLALEYIDGVTLLDYINVKNVLAESEASRICAQIVSAMEYIHKRGVIHRDLKPENILIDAFRVVLVDFGLSNTWSREIFLLTHCGSAAYAAPELFTRGHHYGPKVDVWSFGVIAFILVSGKMPFVLDDQEDQNSSDALEAFAAVLQQGLVKEHFQLMSHLSHDCKLMLMNCLNPNQHRRPYFKDLSRNPWIKLGQESSVERKNHNTVDDATVALEVKNRLRLDKSASKILNHLEKRKLGTTGGCFNLVKLDLLNPLENRVKEDSSMAEVASSSFGADKNTRKTIIKESQVQTQDEIELLCVVKSSDLVQQSTASRRQWQRTWLDKTTSDPKIVYSRLMRIDYSNKTEEKSNENMNDSFTRRASRVFADITNSVRALIGRTRSPSRKPEESENKENDAQVGGAGRDGEPVLKQPIFDKPLSRIKKRNSKNLRAKCKTEKCTSSTLKKPIR